jgi:hypothetical protein
MTTTITRQNTVIAGTRTQRVADLDRNYRGQRKHHNQPRAVPAELHLSEFDPASLDLSALNLVGLKVVHFAQGMGATVDIYGTILMDEQPMHCALHLGDTAYRFVAKSVEAWIKTLGFKESGRKPWQTSQKTGDEYETILFGLAQITLHDDAFSSDQPDDVF